MHVFKSDLSKKEFPVTEKVPGHLVRDGIMKEIKKAHPDFDEKCSLSRTELNQFRDQYIQRLLTQEIGTMTDLEKTVMDSIQRDSLLADEASEVKNPGTRGQRMADKIASFGGSWTFITIFGVFILGWMVINILWLNNKGFDPYPFILLNLFLSCLAAIQAPVIMMSQNRQEEKDRERARNDYMVNLKSELEIRMLHEKIDHLIMTQQENLMQIQQIQVDMIREIGDKIDKVS